MGSMLMMEAQVISSQLMEELSLPRVCRASDLWPVVPVCSFEPHSPTLSSHLRLWSILAHSENSSFHYVGSSVPGKL